MFQPLNRYITSPGRLFLTAGLILAITVSCTRDPVDPEREAVFNESEFTFQMVMASEPILDVVAASASDGRLAAAVQTGSGEVTVVESSAGAWSEIGTITDTGLEIAFVDIAPAQSGAWWILLTDFNVGPRLYRVGAGLDSTLTIPSYASAAWDTVRSCISSDSDGRPIVIARAFGESLIRAALVDTGWALSPVAQTSESSRALDFLVESTGEEHLVFRALLGGTASYQHIEPDSVTTASIVRTEEHLTLSSESDGTAHILGPLSDINIIVFWNVDVGLDLPETLTRTLELYLPSSAAVFDLDDRPYLLCGKFRSPGRYDLLMFTRSPSDFDVNWEFTYILQDAPSNGARNRLQGFTLVSDALGIPHILFLSGQPGNVNSTLWEAIPRN